MGERPTLEDLRRRERGMEAHPKVEDARKLGKRDGLRRCIVLFEMQDGRIGYASYGETKALCDDTREVADACYGTLERELMAPSAPDGSRG